MRNHDDSAFFSEFHSPVLKEKQGGDKSKAATATEKVTSQRHNSKKQVINPSSSKSKNSASCSFDVNKRRKLAASTNVISSNCVEKDIRKRKKTVSQFNSVTKSFGPAEISVMKKNPKMQPLVKLVDLYKDKCIPVVPEDGSNCVETENNFSVTKKFSKEYKKTPHVPSKYSISSFETNEEINLIAESEIVDSEPIIRKNCSYQTVEAEHCSNTMEVEYSSDKSLEFELSSDKTMEIGTETNDLSSFQERGNSEQVIHQNQDCSCTKEFCPQEKETTIGAKLKHNDSSINTLDSSVNGEEFQEKNKNEDADTILEVSDLKQPESLETDKNPSPSFDLSFIKGRMHPRTPSPSPPSPFCLRIPSPPSIIRGPRPPRTPSPPSSPFCLRIPSPPSIIRGPRPPRTPSPPSSPFRLRIPSPCPRTPSPPSIIRGPRPPRTPSPPSSPFRLRIPSPCPRTPSPPSCLFGRRSAEFSDDDTDAMYTPKSPPTPDRIPSTIDCGQQWTSSSPVFRRGPRTPPDPLPSTPEGLFMLNSSSCQKLAFDAEGSSN
ncbi:uncharacterized protein LOC129235213 [Uloborus diversus]|uniref:uncharacterized protein LOC129235213 n=1 Tax=Uloborus diversus TaxID=327109 RepID=UPI002409DAF4|nr:uncharacterized protein LOC129235213 [Uloborus diversus]